ncbi:hypothetical protein EVAR_8158_1 [Eumeta japonica]|uniref:Uncharacterized protein n=1 Tax=Eumeta variegata TaxID=151549 RepID=A0A4C1TSW7_EUMVA|nr:hypothetical protein EVAR_8158_1 [Eumeta japonica]
MPFVRPHRDGGVRVGVGERERSAYWLVKSVYGVDGEVCRRMLSMARKVGTRNRQKTDERDKSKVEADFELRRMAAAI